MVKALHVIYWITMILVILVGVLFVFGDKVLQISDDGKLSGGSSNPENIVETGETGGTGEVGGTEEVRNPDVGGGSFEEVAGASNCKMQQIQYSLRNFKNNVECTDSGDDGCTRLVVDCSMEVYSFNRDVSGSFGIRYSLVDSDDKELDFELIEKEVGFGTPVVFSAEFVRSNMLGVDENLTCPFSVETVPRKEVCN